MTMTLSAEPHPEEVPIGPMDDPEAAPPEPFAYDEQSANLVEDFMKHPVGEAALDEIGDLVLERFESAYAATEAYRVTLADNWKLFEGVLKPKNEAFKDAANMHVPIALENISRIYFRAVDELFSDWQNVFGVTPLGEHDLEAELLTTHGNWQIRSQITDFVRQMHAAILGYFFIGDVTIHSFYNDITKMNRHEVLTPDEFVVPYRYTSRMSDYSDVPFVVKVVTKYKHELQQMRGVWQNIDEVLEEQASFDDDPEPVIHDKQAATKKIEKPEGRGMAPHKILLYEGYLSLPAQGATEVDPEGDDNVEVDERFVQVAVDKRTKKVLLLGIHERPNWQDKLRFETQQQNLIAYRGAVQAHQQAVQQQLQQLQQHVDLAVQIAPTVGPLQGEAIQQGVAAQAQIPSPTPPSPPVWMKNPQDLTEQPEPARMEPVHLFTHAVCIEPLVGNLGLGFGMIQADYNKAGNTALNQFVDAATLNNIKSFLVTENVEFNADGKGGGKIAIGPGTMNKVSGLASQDLRENIIPLEFGPANPQLLEVVKLAVEYGQSSAQAPEALSGEPGKSGETARGLGMRIEQATKQLSVPTRKFADTALVQILRNNAYLNSIYLADEEIFAVQDNVSQLWQTKTIGRKLYDRNYNVEIRADLRFVSQTQRIQEADEMVALVTQNPILRMDVPLTFVVIRKAFEARGRQDLIPYLGPPPPPPATTFGMPPPPPPPPPGAPPPGAAPPGNGPPAPGPPQGGHP